MDKEEILTGIRFYQYQMWALFLMGSYSIYNFSLGYSVVGATLLLSSITNTVLIITRIRGQDFTWLRDMASFTIILAVVVACYYLGIRGIVWVFPNLLGVFFFYPLKRAVIFSTLTAVASLLAALNTLEADVVLRMIFPMTLTVVFAYIYRAMIHKEQRSLEKEANEDHLTGLFNRRSFNKWLDRAISNTVTQERGLALFFIDIDDFKLINDTYGHKVGDLVLSEVSKRLVENIRPTDQIATLDSCQLARIAGDEFVIGISQVSSLTAIRHVAERLLKAVIQNINVEGLHLNVTCSIGVTICNDNQSSSEALMFEADAAMYKSKQLGKNRVTFYDQQIAEAISLNKKVAAGLKLALQNNQFYLNFMPMFSDKGRTISGVEVLIRCDEDSLQGIGPDTYIQVAEEIGLIEEIDLMVVETTFKYLNEVKAKLREDFTIAINISAKELANETFPQLVEALADKYAINRSKIEFEITETSLVKLDDAHVKMLNDLKAYGFQLSLDDFGTGYTAFSQLQNYPVDTLKIDRSFVWKIGEQSESQKSMVDIILSLAKLYDVKVVAEGVETESQLSYLVEADCDYFQGYLLSKPLSWDDFRKVANL
ncbi:EAL domain-containing protein [Psychrosphaera sp.]|nr:EAL domain-containing protein [Psychrosphaera sp.]